ncbi:MAG: hypothetical protein ACPGXX_12345, partial [Planctomycetaceae bacterium]
GPGRIRTAAVPIDTGSHNTCGLMVSPDAADNATEQQVWPSHSATVLRRQYFRDTLSVQSAVTELLTVPLS